MTRPFFISALIHSLLVGALFFIPGIRKNIYTGDRIQPVYLVTAPRVSFRKAKEETTFVRRKAVFLDENLPIEIKSLKEKILERYNKREKQKHQEAEKKIIEEKSVEPVSRKEASLLFPSNFPYNWYIDLLRDKIYTNWSPPSKFSILREEAAALFSFRILREGTIERIRLKRSSKIEILDQSAKKSLESIKILPPLPDDWKQGYLDVTIRFRVEE